MVLLLVCSVPFLTSIVIRMIAWIPLLGRNGLVNRLLLGIGAVDGPQEWMLYSEFAVILGYVHVYTLTMVKAARDNPDLVRGMKAHAEPGGYSRGVPGSVRAGVRWSWLVPAKHAA
jgi:hypothetical protein